MHSKTLLWLRRVTNPFRQGILLWFVYTWRAKNTKGYCRFNSPWNRVGTKIMTPEAGFEAVARAFERCWTHFESVRHPGTKRRHAQNSPVRLGSGIFKMRFQRVSNVWPTTPSAVEVQLPQGLPSVWSRTYEPANAEWQLSICTIYLEVFKVWVEYLLLTHVVILNSFLMHRSTDWGSSCPIDEGWWQ